MPTKMIWADTMPMEVTPADIAKHWPPRRGGMATCSGWACAQGRGIGKCRTPDACQLPEADDLNAARAVIYWVLGVLAVWCLAALGWRYWG